MGTGCGFGVEAYRRFQAYAGEPDYRGLVVSGQPCPTVYDPDLVGRFGLDFRRVGLPELSGGGAAALSAETEQAIVARAPSSGPFGLCVESVGLEAFLSMLHDREEDAAALVAESTEALLGVYRLLLDGAGPFVHLVEVADDYAYAGGPFLAPATFAHIFQPALALIVETIRGLAPGAAILFHSCGAVLDLLPGLLEAGIDVLSPLDPTGRGMTPEVLLDTARRVRTASGGRLVLHGGFDPRTLTGTEDDIRREVRRLVTTLGADGSYILAPAGDVLEDVPPRNLEAFFRIAAEEGAS